MNSEYRNTNRILDSQEDGEVSEDPNDVSFIKDYLREIDDEDRALQDSNMGYESPLLEMNEESLSDWNDKSDEFRNAIGKMKKKEERVMRYKELLRGSIHKVDAVKSEMNVLNDKIDTLNEEIKLLKEEKSKLKEEMLELKKENTECELRIVNQVSITSTKNREIAELERQLMEKTIQLLQKNEDNARVIDNTASTHSTQLEELEELEELEGLSSRLEGIEGFLNILRVILQIPAPRSKEAINALLQSCDYTCFHCGRSCESLDDRSDSCNYCCILGNLKSEPIITERKNEEISTSIVFLLITFLVALAIIGYNWRVDIMKGLSMMKS